MQKQPDAAAAAPKGKGLARMRAHQTRGGSLRRGAAHDGLAERLTSSKCEGMNRPGKWLSMLASSVDFVHAKAVLDLEAEDPVGAL